MRANKLHMIVASKPQWGSVALRIPAGIIFAAHGVQKLFGGFGGYGLEGTGQFMASQGFEPGFLMALIVGCAEFFGGFALVLGIFTRPVAALLALIMLLAGVVVHGEAGLFLSNGGFEFALSLFAMMVALLCLGGGRYSVDTVIACRIR